MRASPPTKPPRMALRFAVLGASLLLGAVILFGAWPAPPVAEIATDTKAVTALLEGARRAGRGADPRPGEPGFPPAVPRALLDEDLDEATVGVLFPAMLRRQFDYDPILFYRARANEDSWRSFPEHPRGGWRELTNSLGLRGSEEVSASPPDLRVLAAGASNARGVCAAEESIPDVLEARLCEARDGRSVEVLNAANGGYNFFNFLGVLEGHAELAPDVFVVIGYGGNDFFSSVKVWRYLCGSGAPSYGPHVIEPRDAPEGGFARDLLATELAQAIYFLNNPGDVDMAISAACSITAEVRARCAERGIGLVLAYLPPPLRGQPDHMATARREALSVFEIPSESLEVSDRIADAWLSFAREQGIATLDARPLFHATAERLYWTSDTHLNPRGYQVVAEALLPLVEAAAQAGR